MSSYSIDPSLYPDPSIATGLGSRALQAQNHSVDDPGVGEAAIPENATHVNQVLKKKRKAREHKACYPCRQRKVKCDLSRPCQTCRDRDHPELCNYNPPNKRPAVDYDRIGAESDAGSNMVVGRYEFDMLMKKLNGLESSMSELRNELNRHTRHQAVDPSLGTGSDSRTNFASILRGHQELHGLHKVNAEGMTEHFSAGSIPVMLDAMKQPNDDNAQQQLREQLETSLMPLFGLDESSTYPFIDLWGLPHASSARITELARVIPNDAQALYLFRNYKSTSYVIFPGVADIEAFEHEFTAFLVDRATHVDAANTGKGGLIFGKTYHWLGLFFAVLASGTQMSDMDRKERTLTSQVYLCCAMESLRLGNFLSRATQASVQALLVIGSVLSDNMNASTAWSLLGLTIRLAQSLGLHEPCKPGTQPRISNARCRVWWAIVWQDSLLSLVYDRAGSDVLVKPNSMHMPTDEQGTASPYQIAMYKLAKVTLNLVHERDHLPRSIDDDVLKEKIDSYHQQVLAITRQSPEHLQDIRRCRTSQQQLEYWVLRLHVSYCLAEVYRPALPPRRNKLDYKKLCTDNLLNTIDAFIGLNAASAYARQSWAAMHRALTAALLLSIVRELTGENERAVASTVKFINIMHDITANVDPQEVAAPIKRGVIALQRLRLPGAIISDDEALPTGSATDKMHTRIGVPPYRPTAVPLGEGNEISPHLIVQDILWGPSVDPTANNSDLPLPR